MDTLEKKDLFLNRMQAKRALFKANIDVSICGRGTGKTRYKAWRYRDVMENMPMSSNAIYSKTFKSLLTNTLGPILEGWHSMGIYRDVHYVIGQKPPSDWPLSPTAPARFDYYLSTITGAGWRIMSEDREDSFRGPSVDSVDADEGLLLNRIKFENGPLMANRGNDRKFGHLPIHHSITLDSSMPIGPGSQWLFDFGKYYEEDGKDYWGLNNKVCELQYQFLNTSDDKERREIYITWKELQKQIVFYPKKIEMLVNGKKKIVNQLFTFFNAFENIDALGLRYLESAMRIMTPATFKTEMLNLRYTTTDENYYNIREEVHLYDAVNYSYISQFGYDFEKLKQEDVRHDSDVDTSRPLDIAIDYGHFINGMRVGQEHYEDFRTKQKSLEYRYLKTFYVKPPEGIPQLVEKFCDYYSTHSNKTVILFHDHTTVGGEGWRHPHLEDTATEFKKRGWKIEFRYIGKAPDHAVKHQLWYNLLSEQDPKFPKIRFNRRNDREGILAMQLTKVERRKQGFGKDKSSERSKSIPREQATDLTDAGDLLVMGRYAKIFPTMSEFIG